MPVTIEITSVYGIKDNGELVNIVVEGNSDEIPYILITIWGKKLNRNTIRQISPGEFNESIDQDIIKSAQCECGDQITIKAYCLANSAISDTWTGELQCFEIGKESAVIVAEGLEAEEVEEVKEVEAEKAGPPEPMPLEVPVLEKEEEAAVIVAEGLEAEAAEEVKEVEKEKVSLPESLPWLQMPKVLWKHLFLRKKRTQQAEEIEEVEEVKEVEEEKVSPPESLPLETPVLEKEEEPAVAVAEGLEIKDAEEIVEGEEVKEVKEEKVSPSESLPLEVPVLEKEEEPAVTVAESPEEKEEKESIPPKPFLFPTIEITTVKGFTYNRDLVDIIVEGNSTGDQRVLIKIQWGNIKYYKIVSPSSSGEFKSSFEQDISRITQSEGGDQINVTALLLTNSAIFDIWKGKLPCVEKVDEQIL